MSDPDARSPADQFAAESSWRASSRSTKVVDVKAVFQTLVLIEAEPEEAGKQLVGRMAGVRARVGSFRVLHAARAAAPLTSARPRAH